MGYRRHRERSLARRPPRRRAGAGGGHPGRGLGPAHRARFRGAGRGIPAGPPGGEGARRRAPRLRAERRAATAGPRVSGAGAGARLGGKLQHQVARQDRGLERAALDPEQHRFLRADRPRLPARRQGDGAGRHRADDQERPRPALASGTRPGASRPPRLRPVPRRQNRPGRMERRRRRHLERGARHRRPDRTELAPLRVRLGARARQLHGHDQGHRPHRRHPAGVGPVEPQGLPLQSARCPIRFGSDRRAAPIRAGGPRTSGGCARPWRSGGSAGRRCCGRPPGCGPAPSRSRATGAPGRTAPTRTSGCGSPPRR